MKSYNIVYNSTTKDDNEIKRRNYFFSQDMIEIFGKISIGKYKHECQITHFTQNVYNKRKTFIYFVLIHFYFLHYKL